MDPEELDRGARLAEFFLTWRADRARGAERTLAECQALFPGMEGPIERELLALDSVSVPGPGAERHDLLTP